MTETRPTPARIAAAVVFLVASVVAVVVYQIRVEHRLQPERELARYQNAYVYQRPAPDGTVVDSNRLAELTAVEIELKEKPRNAALLAQKIHLALDVNPAVAVEECRRILERDPRNAFALHHCAVGYMLLADYKKALHFAGAAYKIENSAELQNTIAQIHYRQWGMTAARDHFQQALKLEPFNANALHGLKIVQQYIDGTNKP